MKKICLFMVGCLLAYSAESSATWITSADQITEEWLTTEGPAFHYTEHIRHLKKVFDRLKVRTFLEFGVGFSTKYFLDNSEKVISVEFVTNGTGPEWFIYCMGLFCDSKNWMPIAYFSAYDGDTSWARYKYMGADSVFQAAAYQPVQLRSYAAVDPSFLDDLSNFISQQVALNAVDMAFVDSGICLRGDLVQRLFNRVPIIVAHDVGPKELIMLNDVYGYDRIVVPNNYEEIVVPFGMGTAFWVKKEKKYQTIIQDLKAYASQEQS